MCGAFTRVLNDYTKYRLIDDYGYNLFSGTRTSIRLIEIT